MKSTITKIAALCLSTLLFTGCAGTAGTNFTQVAGEDNLALGRSTPEQVTANLGKPMREGTITKNGQIIKTSNYAYANTHGDAVAEGVIPTRSQAFYFANDKLVGYDYTSSWKSDSTNFNTANVTQIKPSAGLIGQACGTTWANTAPVFSAMYGWLTTRMHTSKAK